MADWKEAPWLAEPFIRTLESWDTSTWTVFEWGAGGSTLFFAEKCAQVYSVEHNPEWYLRVVDEVAARGLTNVVLQHVDTTEDWSAYTSAIDRTGPEQFDLVLVDGRERVACTLAALKGHFARRVLVLDNAARGRYEPARKAIKQTLPDWSQHVAIYSPERILTGRITQSDTWYWTSP